MLRAIILITVIAAFVYAYESVLFGRGSALNKLARIPIQSGILAILVLTTLFGFRGDPETVEPQAARTDPVPEVETTATIPQPVQQLVAVDPLHPQEAAAACVEHALDEARAAEDLVAETWLSSVEGFLETAPGEVTVQFAVGPKAGPAKGPHCRSEARLTCAVTGRDVKPITPIHMTGAQIAC